MILFSNYFIQTFEFVLFPTNSHAHKIICSQYYVVFAVVTSGMQFLWHGIDKVLWNYKDILYKIHQEIKLL